MPVWSAGLGFSSPDANKLRSPDSALDLSSTSSDTKRANMDSGDSESANGGLHSLADRDRHRAASASSRTSRSNGSLPAIEDAGTRERSPKRTGRLRDISDSEDTFGPRRSRDRRGGSPLSITNRRSFDYQDGPSQKRLTNASASADDRMVVYEEDNLGEDLEDLSDEDMMAGNIVSSHPGSGSWAPTGVDAPSPLSGTAQSFGPPAAHIAAAQYNSDSSVTTQVVAFSDQRGSHREPGFRQVRGRFSGCTTKATN